MSHPIVDTTTPKPPPRSTTPRSDSPIRMKTDASIRNTSTSQNEVPRMRVEADSTLL
ncbi:hypothetical protein D3C86_2178770 [compost metagenome]